MPAQNVKALLRQRLGNAGDQAVVAHANDETVYGRIELPPGIEHGIAQITVCTIDQVQQGKENAGKLYWRAEASVIEPEYVDYNGQKIKCRYLFTSDFQMLEDTKDRNGQVVERAANIKECMNKMRKIGGEDCTAGCTTVEDLADVCDAIQEAKPYIKFSTRLGKKTPAFPNPKTFHSWIGCQGLEDYTPPEDFTADQVQDNGKAAAPAPTPPVNRATKPVLAPSAAPAKNGTAKPAAAPGRQKAAPPKPAPLPAPQPEFDEFQDLNSLGQQAQEGDENAQIKLGEMATAVGLTPAHLRKAPDWNAVAKMIGDLSSPVQAESNGGEETTEFNVGDVVVHEGINCKVTVSDKDTQRATCQSLKDGKKVFRMVPWSSLTPA